MGTTVAHARRLLTSLARAHLIRPVGQALYAMHDLLRVYAAELAAACDSDCREALRRLQARATPIGIPRLRRSSTNGTPKKEF